MIPIDVFRPIGNKIAVRQVLNLPLDGAIVLCGAQTVSDPRKGTRFLIDALKKIREKRRDSIKVVAFGYKPSDGTLPDDWVHTGTIHDEALLNLYYNAADVFVLPSLADNLPNTLIEATAAGTPSVTFDSGGCAEVVRDGANGFVARAGDAGHLAECIEKVLAMKDDQRLEMGEACRQIALREYDPKMQAQRYIELFESIQSRRQFSQ
jgi:glycosyltransferase involved in cell wall biosynthesis